MEGFQIVPTAISILVVLAVLAATLMTLRWVTSLGFGQTRRSGKAGSSLNVVERHSMGRSGTLLVVRYGGREHVLGVTESSITHLVEGTIDLRDQIAAEAEAEEADSARRNPVVRTIEMLREKSVRR